MSCGTKFWISMAVFQVIFGLAVFAITRHYYIQDSDGVSANATAIGQRSLASPRIAPLQLESSTSSQPTTEDPAVIARQADEFFADGQYNRAAELYERLLALGSNNAETYNNLGITLHYLGRSTEALSKLKEGVAMDPTYQRIWLTLGFVNGQLGNIGEARTALTTASEMGADTEVGQSALAMLEDLP